MQPADGRTHAEALWIWTDRQWPHRPLPLSTTQTISIGWNWLFYGVLWFMVSHDDFCFALSIFVVLFCSVSLMLALQLFKSRVGPSSKRSMQKLHRSALHSHYTWRKNRSWDSWNEFGNILWHWRANAMMLESRSSKHHRWIWWRHPCTHW
jgi:hypothetical protein